jgi:hypothetical protein
MFAIINYVWKKVKSILWSWHYKGKAPGVHTLLVSAEIKFIQAFIVNKIYSIGLDLCDGFNTTITTLF